MDVAANDHPLVISPKTDLFSQSSVPYEYEEALEHQVPAYYLKGPGDDILFHVDATNTYYTDPEIFLQLTCNIKRDGKHDIDNAVQDTALCEAGLSSVFDAASLQYNEVRYCCRS